MLMVDLAIRAIGRSAAVEERTVQVGLAEGTATLGDLVSAIVESEVEAFRQRTADGAVIQLLTEGAVVRGLATGKILSGEVETSGQVVDDAAAVEAAHLAHRDGLYEAVVNDRRVVSLEDEVQVSDGMSLMFIRLVALRGG